jgi:hypothetical protein
MIRTKRLFFLFLNEIFPFRQGPLERKKEDRCPSVWGDIIQKKTLRLLVYVKEEVHPLLLFE